MFLGMFHISVKYCFQLTDLFESPSNPQIGKKTQNVVYVTFSQSQVELPWKDTLSRILANRVTLIQNLKFTIDQG